jgi:large subunit ribosomal protein L7Ae
MAKGYVKFSTPGDVQSKALEVVEAAKNAGGLRKGTNEATKAIERGEAKLVVIAEDVDPEEIVMHLPQLCGEKGVPYCYVGEKSALGKAAGLGVGTSAVAVTKPGAAEESLRGVVSKLSGLTGAAPAKPAGEAKPAAPKKKAEKPAAEKK